MTTAQQINSQNPIDDIVCPCCKTLLPSHAVFCSFCGERVSRKKSEGSVNPINKDNDNAQEQEAVTVRLPWLSEMHLKRWKVAQSLQMEVLLDQEHRSGSLLQDVAATPVPDELLPSLPTTPVPSSPLASNWLWPMIIIFSTLATTLVTFVFPATSLRSLIAFWFLFVCPGMVFVRFLRLHNAVAEWTLGIALSFAIDAIVAALFLYAGKWSPTGILSILIGLCLIGALIQLVTMYSTLSLSQLQLTMHIRKARVLFPMLFVILVLLLIGMIVGSIIWSYVAVHNSHPLSSKAAHQTSLTPPPTSNVSSSKGISYSGTIFDISANITSKMSLTGLSQGTIIGTFTGLNLEDLFKGSIDASKHIRFTVMDHMGHPVLSFDGMVKEGGYIAGSYCSFGQQGQCSNGPYGYGIWKITPVSKN